VDIQVKLMLYVYPVLFCNTLFSVRR